MPDCPSCAKTPLAENVDRSGVVFDKCPKCRGLWLDAGELSRLLNKPAPEALLSAQQGERLCVRCRRPMPKGGFISPLLVVDRCSYCSGVWLDASELRVVRQLLGVDQATEAEQVKAEPAPEEPPQPARPVPTGLQGLAEPPAGPGAGAPPTGSAPAPWLPHCVWWLVAGIGAIVYGFMKQGEWKALMMVGSSAGTPPALFIYAGIAMLVLGVVFLGMQPDDPTDVYQFIFKILLTPRRRRGLWGRTSANWYDY